MKVLLVAVNAKYIHSNLAVYDLKAYTENIPVEVELAEYTINQQQEEILRDIYEHKADVVAFSCYIWNITYVKALAEELHKIAPQVQIWFGGPEASECMDYGSNPNEIWFLMSDDGSRILAFGQLRPYDTPDALTWAGHIGYSVPPSERGHGYAQETLKRLLQMGFDRGMERILLTCDVDNDPSRHIIEKAGGVFSGFYRDEEYNKRLYWFTKKG